MTNQNKQVAYRSRRLLGVSTSAAFLIAAALPAMAQTPIELEGIIVSGGLTPVEAANFGRSSTVITGEEMQRRGIKLVADALRQVPGFHVSRAGGLGGQTQIRIRGAEANHVLVLIDGIETADASGFGSFEFSNLTAEEIERVEVLRGPQSSLYGSDALAGVINIITKRGIRNGFKAGATTEGGSSPAKAFSGLLRGGTDWLDIAMSLSKRDDEGWDASDGGGETDGLENTTFSTKVTADFTRDLSLQGVFRWTNRDNEFDRTAFGCGDPDCYVVDADNFTTGRDRLFGLFGRYAMFDGALVHAPFFQYSDGESQTPAFGSENEASKLKYGYKATLFFGPSKRHSLTGLIESEEEEFESRTSGFQSRRQVNYAGEYKGYLTDNFFVQGSVRQDNNDEFDDALTWAASASYRFAPIGTRVHASVGKGIVNPSFFEQFGFSGNFVGNPSLTPEESIGWDAGVEQTLFQGALVVDVTYFEATLTDEISSTTLPSGFRTPINQLGESDRRGVEVSATVSPLPSLFVTASYTYLEATDPDGQVEVRRPEHAGGVSFAYTFLDGRAHVGADLTYNGENEQSDFSDPTFTSPRVTVDDYFVVDFNASYLIADNVKLYGVLNNVFDEDYQEVLGFSGQPQRAYVGLKVGY